ncbi:hypothetical protein V1227_06975 [Lentzea sp. DG1S-22]|uniref:hypothetical protein n=1 Tax=Lentzea sp. DG1S-22 TaxID=3108822 RepID=UPI002E765220|nr:hypothetical protein [Lentzea sp. DG1S-22]WVH82493.1 hypothetical protein V1227_06975 [Lentzea sp. DG1S-22]
MSDQGKTYQTFIETELKAERERRTAYDARGQALITTSSALVTVLAGLVAIVRTGTAVRIPTSAQIVVTLALVLFVCSAASGIAAGWNRHYAVAKYGSLKGMVEDHWTDDEVDARNNVAYLQALTVNTLRQGNRFKAACVSVGLITQVAALSALGSAVVMIICRL